MVVKGDASCHNSCDGRLMVWVLSQCDMMRIYIYYIINIYDKERLKICIK
jgi:hypothetical protein